MVRFCVEINCNIRATYNFKNEKYTLYCSKHKKDGMINIYNKTCLEFDCNIQPTFNYNNEIKGIYCDKHKKENMINVLSKKCLEINCNIKPNFNYENEIKGIYCAKHKKYNMIDIKNKKCLELNCTIQPRYNLKGEKKGIYCYTHKKENMINVISYICNEINCNIRPTFNFEWETRGIYCVNHKKENMIDIMNKNKQCISDNCITMASFNIEKEIKALYCTTHKKDGMINIIDKICKYDGCRIQPVFNFEGEKMGIYCSTHKKDGMIDIKNHKCKTLMCDTILSNIKYDGYCLRCFVYLFPDRPNLRNYKTKEKTVIEYIFQHFPKEKYTWITDKKIQDGCSSKRPDLLLDLGYQVIIIEIDENQHRIYDCSCENKRLMELSQDVCHRPIIFIRFNPDEYIDKDNINITSCWGINGKGICTVKKTKIKEWEYRLNILKENIEYWCNNNTNKTVEIIQLFYNQNN